MPNWKTIPHLPMYEASDTGLIRSKARTVRSHRGVKSYRKVLPSKVLTPRQRITNGKPHYMDVKINGVHYYIHRLVAITWHADTYFEGAEVNHLNSNKYDNRACNLEWVTRSQNLLHSYQQRGKARSQMRGVARKRCND